MTKFPALPLLVTNPGDATGSTRWEKEFTGSAHWKIKHSDLNQTNAFFIINQTASRLGNLPLPPAGNTYEMRCDRLEDKGEDYHCLVYCSWQGCLLQYTIQALEQMLHEKYWGKHFSQCWGKIDLKHRGSLTGAVQRGQRGSPPVKMLPPLWPPMKFMIKHNLPLVLVIYCGNIGPCPQLQLWPLHCPSPM